MYNFGVYHWRRHLGSILLGALVLVASGVVRRRTDRTAPRFLAAVASIGILARLAAVGHDLLTPAPWAIDREKYDVLGDLLDVRHGDRVLDLGCGTGRSLVGLAPWLPAGVEITALDVFDNRIVLGNTPQRARENARQAGLLANPIVGDATRLPLATDSQDVVLISRLLHDLPPDAASETLAEVRRVLAPDGQLGVVELPLVPGEADPEDYWRDCLTDAGFAIESVRRPPWKDGRQYVIHTASPS